MQLPCIVRHLARPLLCLCFQSYRPAGRGRLRRRWRSFHPAASGGSPPARPRPALSFAPFPRFPEKEKTQTGTLGKEAAAACPITPTPLHGTRRQCCCAIVLRRCAAFATPPIALAARNKRRRAAPPRRRAACTPFVVRTTWAARPGARNRTERRRVFPEFSFLAAPARCGGARPGGPRTPETEALRHSYESAALHLLRSRTLSHATATAHAADPPLGALAPLTAVCITKGATGNRCRPRLMGRAAEAPLSGLQGARLLSCSPAAPRLALALPRFNERLALRSSRIALRPCPAPGAPAMQNSLPLGPASAISSPRGCAPAHPCTRKSAVAQAGTSKPQARHVFAARPSP